MKTKLVLLLLILCFSIDIAEAQKRKIKKANEETTEWKYDIEPETMGVQNSKVIRVWSYSKKVDIAKQQATKNAVHGVIFKGIAGNTDKRISPTPALVSNLDAQEEFKTFFDAFFADGGDYRAYVTTTDIADSVVKIDRKVYKVGVVVTVRYDDLRKLLESKGVIKKLGSGF